MHLVGSEYRIQIRTQYTTVHIFSLVSVMAVIAFKEESNTQAYCRRL